MSTERLPRTRYWKPWQRELASRDGDALAHQMMDDVKDRYAVLYQERKRYNHPALRKHLEENILPGLALYQVLLDKGYEQVDALETVEQLYQVVTRSGRRTFELLGRFPVYYQLLRATVRRFMERNFPPEGWQVEWVEVSGEQVAFNMHACFYVDVLGEYGVPELTPVFCGLDDYIYEGVSPHVRWARTGTIGRGDALCDFRYVRVHREE
jgi:hypothetical protein